MIPDIEKVIEESYDKVILERTELAPIIDGYIVPSRMNAYDIDIITQEKDCATIKYKYTKYKANHILETKKNKDIPIWKKYLLTIEEATIYFNIGDKKLREFIKENPRADYLLHNGNKTLIKREKFEKTIDLINII